MAESVRRRIEEVRERVKGAIERVTGGRFSPQIGGGKLSGIVSDIVDTVNEYVSAARAGKVTETMRVAPLRKALEKRIPAISKIPRIRETVSGIRTYEEIPPRIPPSAPPAPKVAPEAPTQIRKERLPIF